MARTGRRICLVTAAAVTTTTTTTSTTSTTTTTTMAASRRFRPCISDGGGGLSPVHRYMGCGIIGAGGRAGHEVSIWRVL